MCILSDEVRTVAKTQIYISASSDNQRQLTVYANQVDSVNKWNSMILPVPFPSSIEFVNIEKYANFFTDLNNCFSDMNRLYASANLTRSAPSNFSRTLEIFEVGSYEASIVPTIADFQYVDPSFQLHTNIQLLTMLKQYYTENFGFIVCRLKQGMHTYHPFAYTHKLYKPNVLFTPTRHYHVHGKDTVHTDTADWDHEIYSPSTDLSKDPGYVFTNSSSVKWNFLPKEYQWAADQRLVRWVTKGASYPNIDITTTSYYQPPTAFVPVISSPSKTIIGLPMEFWERLHRIIGVLK